VEELIVQGDEIYASRAGGCEQTDAIVTVFIPLPHLDFLLQHPWPHC
jgi:hypothetical protein